MTTHNVDQNPNLSENLNELKGNFISISHSNEYFNTLNQFKHLDSYQDLGHNLISILKVCRVNLLY